MGYMETTLQEILTKVAPFADRVEGDTVQFVANDNMVVVAFEIRQTDTGWVLIPRPKDWVHSEGPGKEAMVRAKTFVRRFKEVA